MDLNRILLVFNVHSVVSVCSVLSSGYSPTDGTWALAVSDIRRKMMGSVEGAGDQSCLVLKFMTFVLSPLKHVLRID